jgi:hypothetical protein
MVLKHRWSLKTGQIDMERTTVVIENVSFQYKFLFNTGGLSLISHKRHEVYHSSKHVIFLSNIISVKTKI